MGVFRILRPNFGFTTSRSDQRRLTEFIEGRVPKDAKRGPEWTAALTTAGP